MIFIFGTIFGSFLNVVIYRVPKDESIAFPASHCQSCKTPLKLYHNIPILAWLALRGKCGFCKDPISKQYPIIEFISGVLFVIAFYHLGFSSEALFASFLFLNLLALSMIDFGYRAVPTSLLVTSVIFALLSNPTLEASKNLLLFSGGATILELFVTYYIQGIKARITKDDSLKEQVAMGSGDIPIFGIIGVLFSIKLALITLFLSSLYAMLPAIYNQIFKKEIETAFIPFLFMGILTSFIFGDFLVSLLDAFLN
jgi:leader peptidase (prepilin peptidase)/N-methyltransferase